MRTLEPGLHLRSYRLIHRLGRGGDGDVWLAVDTRGREVALKARPRGDGSDEQRLRREFERLRTLRLPSVIRVLDVGADQGYTFFTMEVARGLSFDRYVAEAPSLDARVRRAAQAGAGVAHALAGIHRLGLAHRDLKPANVMVDAHGVVTLLDFGNVRFGNAQDDSGEYLGTLSYMAPEQRLGLPHDHRVDCYALGVTLYTALTGTPASLGAPGRPRTSLALLGREVPLGLAWLVDRLLALDPARRPTAEEAEAVMTAVARGEPLPPAPWPEPPSYAGDPSPLLNSSGVVSGAAGSGRRRMVAEARWQWYRRGYRSFAGLCREDTPYGALRSVLTELFATPDPTERRRLAGEDGPALAAIWPDLPVPVRALSWPPDAHDVALSLARVFGRVAPAAIVLWDLDRADPGTQAVLPTLAAALPDRIRLWGTSRRPVPGLRRIAPPGWGPDQEAMILPELLPDGTAPVGPAGLTPLHSMARAWCALARWRGEAGPAFPPPLPLVALAVLDEPFPRKVAELLVGDLGQLIEAGQLGPPRGAQAPTQGEWLAFNDRGTRRLARAAATDPTLLHLSAADAWRRARGAPDAGAREAIHRIRGDQPSIAGVLRGVRTALRDNSPVEVDRWLQLKDLWKLGDDDFTMAFARLYAALELRPARVGADDLRVLASRAMTAEQRGQAAWLQVIHDARVGDRAAAVARGQADADRLAGPFPALAANILREVALARLEDDDVEGAVRDCRQALALAQDAVWRETADDPTEAAPLLERPRPGVPPPVRLTQTEVNAATTLSASLLWGGRTREGVDFCAEMASRCGEARLARGQGAFLSNLAAGQLFLGQRDESTHSLALCREIQSLHGDPVVLAWCATFQARLAIERGDLSAGRQFLDEAITAGQALSNGRLLAEAWSLVLEAAVQSADAAEAQRALATYGSGGIQSTADHWPAVLGRWRWMVGDLEGALAAVSEPRLGYNGLCVEAERCRLLLVGGDNDAAWRAGNALARRASESEMDELALFARLVAGAAIGAPDAEYTDLVDRTRRSRWVHLYLGALHLDAIRRQLRGENVGVVLRQLRSRALDLNHKLYAALAREEGW